MSWPTEAEQRRIAHSLLEGFPEPDRLLDEHTAEDCDEFAQGIRVAINALLYREAPRGWEE